MQNTAKKKAIIIGTMVLALVITVILIILLTGREDSYRVVKIYEFDGKATVTREETGEIEVYPNMVLASGDEVFLEEGLMTLKLDEDKYVYVEEQTRFALTATGKAADSKTTIQLMEGAIINEIQSPLKGDASYEVHTQNSSMSVRGTTFRVAITYDEAGVMYTKVSVFEGKVETQLVFKDGTMADPRIVESGKETVIFEDDLNTDYLEGITDITYEELTKSAVETLLGLVKEGLQIGVTEEELQSLLEEDGKETDDEDQSESEEETPDEADETDDEEDADDSEETDDSDDSDDSGDDGSGDSGNGDDSSDTPGATVTYTVTFTYDGVTFATQSVAAGGLASKPLLMPNATGSWDFDFSTAITQDTTIEWK